ncbi:MAG: hypothetical protein IKM94_01300, partial [Alphaproteobacteria bacterium]|nr:hypothetical protein [Alphaproteobacteria bacterium]
MKKLLGLVLGLMVSISSAFAGNCNLWDLNNMGFSSNLGHSITETGFTAQGDSNLDKYVYSKTVYEAGTYIFTFNSSAGSTYVVYGVSDLSKISLNGNVVTTDNTGIRQTLGMGHGAYIVTNNNRKVIIESAVPFKIGFAIPPSITISNLQIKKGSTVTDYTPYNANCLTCEGNFMQSHNLTQKVINRIITGNGASQSAFSININDITYKPNTQYTITLDVEAHDITYNQSGNLLWWSIQYTDDSYTYAGIMTYNYMNPRVSVVTSANKTVKAIIGPQTHQRWTGGTLKVSNLQIEEGTTATPYIPYGETACIPIIKIATTAYNSAQFSPVVTELNTTIATIRDVVTNTINQTKAIADLQATKQTRPDETCPAGKKCLLVEDDAGQPHWYEIIE